MKKVASAFLLLILCLGVASAAEAKRFKGFKKPPTTSAQPQQVPTAPHQVQDRTTAGQLVKQGLIVGATVTAGSLAVQGVVNAATKPKVDCAKTAEYLANPEACKPK